MAAPGGAGPGQSSRFHVRTQTVAALVGLAIGLIGLAVAIGAWLLPNSDDDPPPVNNSINGNCNAQGSSNTVACSGIPSSPKK